VVGLLSARLAERQSRSDVRLIAATQSLANLRALHERIVESIKSEHERGRVLSALMKNKQIG